jgi:hypothetical protein
MTEDTRPLVAGAAFGFTATLAGMIFLAIRSLKTGSGRRA